MAGTVAGHSVVSMLASGLGRIARSMRVSVSHPGVPTRPIMPPGYDSEAVTTRPRPPRP